MVALPDSSRHRSGGRGLPLNGEDVRGTRGRGATPGPYGPEHEAEYDRYEHHPPHGGEASMRERDPYWGPSSCIGTMMMSLRGGGNASKNS
jgi:hypothetical protein